MRYTTLGKTGLAISKVGFGGIPIRRLEREEALAIVRRALELGVTFYDTAKGYGDSEEKIGEALAGRRHEVVLATKTPSKTKAEAAADIEQSLRRLRTDYIDLYQLHNVASEAAWQQVMGEDGALAALLEAKRAGKIGHIGITSHSHDIALKALRSGAFETLMIAFSYLESEAEERVLPLCREMGVAFICMKPFSGGALDTPVQCLKWVLGRGVTVAIPGIGSLAELEEDLSVADMDWHLTAEDMTRMEQVKAETGKTFCRGCDYCQPCSSGVNIAVVLRSTSLLRRAGPAAMANGQFERIVAWAESCVQCGECEPRCPYGLAIPDLLQQRVAELRAGLSAAGWNV